MKIKSVDTCLVVLLIAIITFNIFVTQAKVFGLSMAHTYHEGDTVWTRSFGLDNVEREDVIVFNNVEGRQELSPLNIPGVTNFKRPMKYIKRVVGVPGDTVEVCGDRVIVNGELINPDEVGWLPERQTVSEHILENDEYFVLGDNRIESLDSRHYGVVPQSHITGVVMKPAPIELNLTDQLVEADPVFAKDE